MTSHLLCHDFSCTLFVVLLLHYQGCKRDVAVQDWDFRF